MTGRKLYEHHSIVRKETIGSRSVVGEHAGFREHHAPVTWDFLPWSEQRIWNALARRITPKKRAA